MHSHSVFLVWLLLIPVSCLLFPISVRAENGPDLPVLGRPAFAPFSNAIGQFQVVTRAAPTTLQAEDPLLFTIRIVGVGTVMQPPDRPDLRELPEFDEAFFIEDRTDQDKADDNSWEFAYRLKPRNTSVTAIPGFPLIYFQPSIVPASKGYLTRWAPAIPLVVRPRREINSTQATDKLLPADAPATLYGFVEDGPILRRQEGNQISSFWIGLLAAAPPIACLGWYLVWRRLYPDAAALARQHRSKAAQAALRSLQRCSKKPARDQAQQVTATVAQYLRQRLELPSMEPTPVEIAGYLRTLQLPPALVEKATHFFQEADAARFLPDANGQADLVDAGKSLILALESDACSPLVS